MGKFARAMFAAVLSVFAIMLVAPAAQAYPAPGVVVHVNRTTVVSGQAFVVSARARTNCAWSATFNGESRAGAGRHFHAKFTAPTVQQRTDYDLSVTCTTATNQVTRHVTITVLPPGSSGAAHAASGTLPNAGGLPNTGGPNAALLGGAGALILVGGATALFAVRRRHTHA